MRDGGKNANVVKDALSVTQKTQLIGRGAGEDN